MGFTVLSEWKHTCSRISLQNKMLLIDLRELINSKTREYTFRSHVNMYNHVFNHMNNINWYENTYYL
jgi:hypothetical protein